MKPPSLHPDAEQNLEKPLMAYSAHDHAPSKLPVDLYGRSADEILRAGDAVLLTRVKLHIIDRWDLVVGALRSRNEPYVSQWILNCLAFRRSIEHHPQE